MFWRVLVKHAQSVVNDRDRHPVESAEVDVAAERMREDEDVPKDLVASRGVPRTERNPLPPPPSKVAKLHKSLRALFGESAGAKRPAAAAVAIAVNCPTCHAPLAVEDGASRATCKYCQTLVMIATPNAVAVATSAPARPPAVWLLVS